MVFSFIKPLFTRKARVNEIIQRLESHKIKYNILEDSIKQYLSNISTAYKNKRRILYVKGKFSFASNQQIKSSLLSLIQRQLNFLGNLESALNQVLTDIIQARPVVGGDKQLNDVKDNASKLLEEIKQYKGQLTNQITTVSSSQILEAGDKSLWDENERITILTKLFEAIHSSEKVLWIELGAMISAKKAFDQYVPAIKSKIDEINNKIRDRVVIEWLTINGEPIPVNKVSEKAFSYIGGGTRAANSWANLYEHWLKDLRKKMEELNSLFYELYWETGPSIQGIRKHYAEELKSLEDKRSRLGNLMDGYEKVMKEIERQSYFR